MLTGADDLVIKWLNVIFTSQHVYASSTLIQVVVGKAGKILDAKGIDFHRSTYQKKETKTLVHNYHRR